MLFFFLYGNALELPLSTPSNFLMLVSAGFSQEHLPGHMAGSAAESRENSLEALPPFSSGGRGQRWNQQLFPKRVGGRAGLK